MVAIVSGIDYAKAQISRTKKKDISPVKAIHIDFSWLSQSSVTEGALNFFSDSDREISNERSNLPKQDNADPEHGTACSAILKTNEAIALSETEQQLWNLAPFADIYALPRQQCNNLIVGDTHRDLLETWMRGDEFEDPETERFERDWFASYQKQNILSHSDQIELLKGSFDDYVDFKNAERSILATFQKVVGLCDEGAIEPGDVIVCPMTIQCLSFCPKAGIIKAFDFPIIQFKSVQNLLQEITQIKSISVIISAGNSGLNLSHDQLPLFFGIEPDRSIYQNRGVACGAILVGAETKHSQRNEYRSVNTGKCIDASGRYEIDDIPSNGNPVLRNLSSHWSLSSGAAMVAAACLLSIQQFRKTNNFPLLKPYEARAHMRQWIALPETMGIGVVNGRGYMGSPPDLKGWMIGTGLVR